jgi:SAM-dependent methyltransferase
VVRSVLTRLGVLAPLEPYGVEKSSAFYDRCYAEIPEYHLTRYAESKYYFVWTVIVDRMRRAGCRRVLDIGCGCGQLAQFMLDQGINEYIGLDFSPKAIEMAGQRARHGEFVVGDARTSDVYTRCDYDAIVCTEVLEHVEADLAIVSRFPPGKRCICSVPSFPDSSHVRVFRDNADVAARYAPFFDGFDVCALIRPEADSRYFLFDGIRNERRV